MEDDAIANQQATERAGTSVPPPTSSVANASCNVEGGTTAAILKEAEASVTPDGGDGIDEPEDLVFVTDGDLSAEGAGDDDDDDGNSMMDTKLLARRRTPTKNKSLGPLMQVIHGITPYRVHKIKTPPGKAPPGHVWIQYENGTREWFKGESVTLCYDPDRSSRPARNNDSKGAAFVSSSPNSVAASLSGSKRSSASPEKSDSPVMRRKAMKQCSPSSTTGGFSLARQKLPFASSKPDSRATELKLLTDRSFYDRPTLTAIAALDKKWDQIPGFHYETLEGCPPLPFDYKEFLASLQSPEERLRCQKAMEFFCSIMRYDNESKVPLEFFREARKKSFGLQCIASQINALHVTQQWYTTCEFTKSVASSELVLKPYFLCWIVGDVRTHLRNELLRRYWRVEHVGDDLESIRLMCQDVAVDFIYASGVDNVQTLLEVAAVARVKSPHLYVVFEMPTGSAAENAVVRNTLGQGSRTMHEHYLTDLHSPVSLWVSSKRLYQRLATTKFTSRDSEPSGQLPFFATHIIARFITAECELAISRACPALRGTETKKPEEDEDEDENEADEATGEVLLSEVKDDPDWKNRSRRALKRADVALLKRYAFENDKIFQSLADNDDLQEQYTWFKSKLWHTHDFFPEEVMEAWADWSASGLPPDMEALVARAEAIRDKLVSGPEQYDFQPQLGMLVRKMFDGEYHVGRVTGEKVDKEDGMEVRLWIVQYEDNDTEEYEYDELLRLCQPCNRIRASPNERPFQGLEAFCGRAVIANQFANAGWEVTSIDNDPDSNATHKANVHALQRSDIEGIDALFGAPNCCTYSYLSGDTNRTSSDYEKSHRALQDNFDIAKLMELQLYARQQNPNAIIIIENPRAQMNKSPLMVMAKRMLGLRTVSVNYCAFGRGEPKPTHLWTNLPGLSERLSGYTCRNMCPHSEYREEMKKHPDSVRNNKAAAHGVIPESLAWVITRYVDAWLELKDIR